ncbi:MAG TPA: DUF6789 family protein [Hyphomicrobium sp.]|nr:DUF6789 family protein [Hyphomicrobium sp.]
MTHADSMAYRTRNALDGMVAGIIATGAMSLFMVATHRLLPREERYPLPPRLITEHTLGGSGSSAEETPIGQASAYAAHFLFGGACGALYGSLQRQNGPPTSGITYALGVWLASYLGWVPVIGAMPPATEQPANRNVLMLAAHVVWGLALEASYRRIRSQTDR